MAWIRKIIKWLLVALAAVILVVGGYLANQRYERSKWHYVDDEMVINPMLSMENLFSQDYNLIVVDSDGVHIKLFVVMIDEFYGRLSLSELLLDLDLGTSLDGIVVSNSNPVDLGSARTETLKVNGRWVRFSGFSKSRYLKPTTTEGAVYLLSELRKGKVELESEHGSVLVFDGSGVDEAYHRLNKRREAIAKSL